MAVLQLQPAPREQVRMPDPDTNAPDPGPRPEEERLTNDQIIAKYGADLKDSELREQILRELVYARKLSVAVNRKAAKETAADNAWIAAYEKRYGTDEG